MSKSSLTQKELAQILHYHPKTGLFTRLTKTSNCISVGSIAGCLDVKGYLRIMVSCVRYKAHRLAWLAAYGKFPKDQIDHINHDRADNRIINLREATASENSKNQTLAKNSTSGVSGVFPHRNKWQASISSNCKRIHLGTFADKFEAICARKSAERKYGFHINHGV